MGQCVGHINSIVPAAQIVKDLMEDFVKINEALGKRGGGFNYDLEKKLLTNFNCGILYISNDWPMPE